MHLSADEKYQTYSIPPIAIGVLAISKRSHLPVTTGGVGSSNGVRLALVTSASKKRMFFFLFSSQPWPFSALTDA